MGNVTCGKVLGMSQSENGVRIFPNGVRIFSNGVRIFSNGGSIFSNGGSIFSNGGAFCTYSLENSGETASSRSVATRVAPNRSLVATDNMLNNRKLDVKVAPVAPFLPNLLRARVN
jgi:hypothetical protein